ncbi:MAG TPA: FAD-dependent monooxygenase [Burkholderiaceae bacterium]|nr:FAD-dependent monooxygenase [Burkholderiaceae bacterium]
MSRNRVAILGAGPIGLACALLLSARGIGSQLLDARSLEQARQDRRLLALSRGTVQLLTGLLGGDFAPMARILDVHVSSAGQFGATRLTSRDFGGNALGATVWYADLVQALARAAQADPDIVVRRPCRVVALEQRLDSVLLRLDSAEPIEATIAINAEGSPAGGDGAAAVALLCEVDVQGLAPDTAVERFTREGPLALLPVPDAATAGDRKSMIWCLDRTIAQQRMALGEDEFARKIQATLGPRSGRVACVGPRSQFPLSPQNRPRLREHRLVHIGNAAQSLHPVAGQGFNLGMRDCVCLADCLARTPRDPVSALSRYESTRKTDRVAISYLTGALPGLFAARGAPIAIARSIALTALDLAGPARRTLSSVLMFGVRR